MTDANRMQTRREFLGVVGGGLLLGATGVSAGADSNDAAWRQPGGDNAHTHSAIDGVGPTGALSKAWSGGVSAWRNGVAVGAVVGDTVYATGERLGAFDIEDGTERWTYTGGPPPEPTNEGDEPDVEPPTVVNGTVYAPIHYGVFDAFDHEQTALVALDADNGEKQWQIDFPVDAALSSVTVADGNLYVEGPDTEEGDGTYIYCLQPEDGAVKWRQEIPGDDPMIATEPLVANDLVFVTPSNGVVAYDAGTGEKVWSALPNVATIDTGLVADGTVYVSESIDPGVTVIALDAESGSQQWKQAFSKNGYVSGMTIDAKRLYLKNARGENVSDIIALNRTDGSEQWRSRLPKGSPDERPPTSVPRGIIARVGSLLYAGATIIDPATGTVQQSFEIETRPMTRYRLEAVAAGKLFLGGRDLIVLEGESTQTATPIETATPTATSTETAPEKSTETTTSPDGDETPSTMQSSSDRPESTTTTDTPAPDEETTTANGPGFGMPVRV